MPIGEIMTLQLEHVAIAGKALRLPDSKTDAKGHAPRAAGGRCFAED
jgi:hypothetical protein